MVQEVEIVSWRGCRILAELFLMAASHAPTLFPPPRRCEIISRLGIIIAHLLAPSTWKNETRKIAISARALCLDVLRSRFKRGLGENNKKSKCAPLLHCEGRKLKGTKNTEKCSKLKCGLKKINLIKNSFCRDIALDKFFFIESFSEWKMECSRLVKKVDFKGKKSIKKRLRLPNFKGCTCKLDFPALHESNFAAHFTGYLILGPEKSVKVDFWGRIVDLKSKSRKFKVSFFRLKITWFALIRWF